MQERWVDGDAAGASWRRPDPQSAFSPTEVDPMQEIHTEWTLLQEAFCCKRRLALNAFDAWRVHSQPSLGTARAAAL
ncbi:hypothetical protein U9M48_034288 [Paspalum notatum var. saurae]|uniref:Uncharacterized protein n=1 Tax=Paspalum notatum var. saurae TaxID=547442 RepID=A0AAQ3X8R7_PASNO